MGGAVTDRLLPHVFAVAKSASSSLCTPQADATRANYRLFYAILHTNATIRTSVKFCFDEGPGIELQHQPTGPGKLRGNRSRARESGGGAL